MHIWSHKNSRKLCDMFCIPVRELKTPDDIRIRIVFTGFSRCKRNIHALTAGSQKDLIRLSRRLHVDGSEDDKTSDARRGFITLDHGDILAVAGLL